VESGRHRDHARTARRRFDSGRRLQAHEQKSRLRVCGIGRQGTQSPCRPQLGLRANRSFLWRPERGSLQHREACVLHDNVYAVVPFQRLGLRHDGSRRQCDPASAHAVEFRLHLQRATRSRWDSRCSISV
jgi:hypothetical protein